MLIAPPGAGGESGGSAPCEERRRYQKRITNYAIFCLSVPAFTIHFTVIVQ
jgi:hypothetical protein